MSDSVYLGLKARQLEDSPTYQPISCVKLTIGGEDANGNPIVCQAGNPNSGRTIETSNPLIWDASIGNTVAQNILAAVQGYAYKPYQADGAIINPAVEIGDAVEVGDVYSVIADVETTFSPLMSANISAPQGSDIDHEYPYESSENRELMQQLQGLKTSFIVENGRIAAEISDMSTNMKGLSNRVASVEMTADNITASLSAYATTDWVDRELSSQLSITAEAITSTVSETYETKNAANSKLNAAKTYTDEKIQPIEGNYTSAINQSAKEIKATVAASETIWNVYSLSQTEQNKFAVYGYGRPSDENSENNPTRPSAYNGKYYLDQSTGQYWRSNGRQWSQQGTITEKLAVSQQSAITQNKDSINSIVTNTIPGIQNQMSQISQKADSISLSVSSDQYGRSTFTLSNNQTVLDTETLYLNVDAAHITGTIYANAVQAGASISSPYISGGSISGSTIIGGKFQDETGYSALQLWSYSMGAGTMYFGPNNSTSTWNAYFEVVGQGNGTYPYTRVYIGGAGGILANGGVMYPQGVWDFSQATVRNLPS